MGMKALSLVVFSEYLGVVPYKNNKNISAGK
jgi:hypothetical protein